MIDVCEIGSLYASKPTGLVASGARSTTLEHLSFAVGPVHSTTDIIEMKSQSSRTLQSPGGQEQGLEGVILGVKEESTRH